MKTISDRIKEALAIRNLKQSDLVSLTGIGKSSISTYISGSYEPKQKNIYKIAKALNVNESWLMGNDVPMERSESVEKPTTNLSKREYDLINKYRYLPDEAKNNTDIFVDSLYDTYAQFYEYAKSQILNEDKLNAAHEIPGASAADKKHDDDIMDDDNF